MTEGRARVRPWSRWSDLAWGLWVLAGVALVACGRAGGSDGAASGGREASPGAAAAASDAGRLHAPASRPDIAPRSGEPSPGKASTSEPDGAPLQRPAKTPAQVHAEAIVLDTHNDVTGRMTDEPNFRFERRNPTGHTDLVRAREGGLDAQFLSVWTSPRRFPGEKGWLRSLAMFDAIDRTVRRDPADLVLARTAADVRRAVAEGKFAFLIGVEGAHSLGEPASPEQALARIRQWYDRGARYLTLTWMVSNSLGGSSGDRGRTRGLTELGRRAVALMNDLGMMVDLSHVSDPTFFDALEVTRLPVIVSHSGVRALADHPRNLTDEMLRALAKNGGAICVVYYPGYLDSAWGAARRESRRTGRPMEAAPVTIERVVEHIDHAVRVAGIDHVCLGSDFDGVEATPVGLEDVSKLPNLTAALMARGYDAASVRKILGENVLRVMEANERGARRRGGVPGSLGGSRRPVADGLVAP